MYGRPGRPRRPSTTALEWCGPARLRNEISSSSRADPTRSGDQRPRGSPKSRRKRPNRKAPRPRAPLAFSPCGAPPVWAITAPIRVRPVLRDAWAAGLGDACGPRRRLDPGIPARDWSGRRDSNPRHPAWKARALPTELLPLASRDIAPDEWWRGEDSNLRRLRRQIYSLFPLTAREPLHVNLRSPVRGRAAAPFGA